ncbi:MAG: hypothetical protein JXM74_10355 [Fusobacteriaceae bacterium]|nr:hypothetical protein [Fusobacteriaceae bacterium]MBN2839143.1 hypothetical protein [Fusobacteriaceae bacterium]
MEWDYRHRTSTNTNTNKTNKTTKVTKSKINEKVVYITKSGKKYYKAGCSSLSKNKIEIILEEAFEQGYEPCKKCNETIKTSIFQ